MKLKCQKNSENSYLGFFVCISTVCIKCVSRKGKALSTNKYTNGGKRCFNLNRKPIIVHNVHSTIVQERNICGKVCLSIYLFTGIPVTIYSTLELSDRVVILGFTPQNLRKNPGGAVD